jgi:hypothetical protein
VSGGCGWGSLFSTEGFTYRWGEPFRAWDEEMDQPLRILRGNSLPDVGFGFGSNLRYKGFSTYVGFRGQIGGKVYHGAKQWAYANLRHGDYDQTGKPDENKKPLDYYQRGLYNGNNWTDVYLEDGTHLKLGEARVSYRLRQAQTRRLLGNMAPNQLTIGANARNLFTWTRNYTGLDPERGTPLSRYEGVGYPHLRNLTMTLDIVF